MKEFERRLTRQTDTSTLKSEGKFMAEPGNGEVKLPGKEHSSVAPHVVVSEAHANEVNIEAARKLLQGAETAYNWHELPVEVRNAAVELIKSGEFESRGPGAMNRPPDESEIGMERIRQILIANGFKEESLRDLDDEILAALAKPLTRERTGFYLSNKDYAQLDADPMGWLEKQFDTLYQVADEGQELNSPVVNRIQATWSDAAAYLQNENPGKLSEFASRFLNRLNLIFARSAVEHRNLQSAQEMSQKLLARGLLNSLTFENRNVYKMFTRLSELLEDKRLADGGKELHVSSEMVSRLQDDLIEEQIKLATKGVGDYGIDYDQLKKQGKSEEGIREGLESKIKRAVRPAYDIFVFSQRQGIIVSRGESLKGVEAYLSDPIGLFNVFNQEDLLTGKFGIYNYVDRKYLDQIKLDIARTKLGDKAKDKDEVYLLDYGKRFLRDLIAVPDFFTSSWRIEGFLNSIKDRIEYEKGAYEKTKKDAEREGRTIPDRKIDDAKDFALFMRLKAGKTKAEEIKSPNDELRRDVWKRIVETRPEEIVRLYRERGLGNPELKGKLKQFFAGNAFNSYRVVDSEGNIDAFKTYDKFKEEFGPIIQYLRQKGYQEFRALKIGGDGFTDVEKDTITKYFKKDANDADAANKADQLQRMYAELSGVAKGAVDDLMENDKFEDIYSRVMVVDDALLDVVESPPTKKITPVSKYWSSEVGGDGLVRNYSDIGHATKAQGAFLNHVKKEDLKEKSQAAFEFAAEAAIYGGVGTNVDALRFTVGTFYILSKQYLAWDVIGMAKAPFRQPSSGIEKIYGPAGIPMSRGDLRVQLDKLYYQMARVDGEEEKARKTYVDLEHLLEVTGEDFAKRKFLQVLLYLFLSALVEPVKTIDSAIKTPSK